MEAKFELERAKKVARDAYRDVTPRWSRAKRGPSSRAQEIERCNFSSTRRVIFFPSFDDAS